MPVTPLHCSVAYLIDRWGPQLNLPALLVGSMTPDLEVPIIFLLTGGFRDRLVLHSLLGAATFGTFLSVLLTVFLYPRVISFFFKLDREKVEERCRFSSVLVVSCAIGGILHVIVDAMTHEFNPVFYPFVKDSFDLLRLTSNLAFSNLIVESVLFGLLIFIFVDAIRKGTRGFWMRMLVG